MAAAGAKVLLGPLIRKCLGAGGVRFSQPARAMAGSVGPWNYLWKPGPYPKTEEERKAAAKKYGMIPEDYKPYPNDDEPNGDYPDIPTYSASAKDQHLWYDDEILKRNFGEPMEYHFKSVLEMGYDPTTRQVYTPEQALWVFIKIVTISSIIMWLSIIYLPFYHPVAAKQLPGQNGDKFYSFEPVE